MRAPSRSRHPATLAVALLGLAACEAEHAVAPAPEQQIMIDLPTLKLVDEVLVLDVMVTRGILQAQAADRFFLGVEAAFADEDLGAGIVLTTESPVVDLTKDAELRRGEWVPFRMFVALDGAWDQLVAADNGAADQIDVAAVIELRLRDAVGGVRVLHRLNVTETIDPKPTD